MQKREKKRERERERESVCVQVHTGDAFTWKHVDQTRNQAIPNKKGFSLSWCHVRQAIHRVGLVCHLLGVGPPFVPPKEFLGRRVSMTTLPWRMALLWAIAMRVVPMVIIFQKASKDQRKFLHSMENVGHCREIFNSLQFPKTSVSIGCSLYFIVLLALPTKARILCLDSL
jgi:hypothetical protein